MYICMYVYMYICICIYVYVYMHRYRRAYIQAAVEGKQRIYIPRLAGSTRGCGRVIGVIKV